MSSPDSLDAIQLNFSGGDLLLLNFALALIMFGIALDLKVEDFKQVIRFPKSFILGVISQFIFLPAFTFGLVYVISPPPSVALGMILVASCPGGNVSNFLSHLSKANTALSISLTAFSTTFAVVLTPLNFAFWSSLYPPGLDLIRQINLEISDVIVTVTLILGLPLLVGILVNRFFPKFSLQGSKILRPLSILIFVVFVLMAFKANFDLFTANISRIFGWVLAHNLLALSIGYLTGYLGGLPQKDRKTLSIETGIQNSGLGLALIFTYFEGIGGMAIIAAWWGIWHLISGLSLASFWRRTA